MCRPKTPAPQAPPPMPVSADADRDLDARAREDTRKRLRGAMNTQASILSQGISGGKSLLGQ